MGHTFPLHNTLTCTRARTHQRMPCVLPSVCNRESTGIFIGGFAYKTPPNHGLTFMANVRESRSVWDFGFHRHCGRPSCHIYVCVCMCICICIHYVCYVCIYLYVYLYVFIFTCMYIHMYMCIYIHIYMYVHTYIN